MTSAPTLGGLEDPGVDEFDQTPAVLRKGGKLYFAASLVSQASALVRYVILARLLGPEQLGLAATLVLTGAFFDMISDTGADRFLIQDRDGDTPAVQKLVQLVYIGRGAMIAAGLLIAAVPLSYFFHAPRLAGGLAVLAVSPVIFGFLHLDLRRAQRRHDFRSEAVCMIASEVAGLIATSIAAWATRDFTAILYGLITRSCVMVLVSHLRAERRYAVGWARDHGPRLAAFAAPLMLSGLMLFIGSQGDRGLVLRLLGVSALGRYSAVILLIYYPSALLLRYMHAVFMPMISAHQNDPAARDAVSDRLGGQTQLLALAMASGFAVVAPPMVTLLYGAKFTEAALVVGLIGILQSTRFLINWPTTVALSMGKSRTVLISNASRLLVFPGAWLGFRLMGGVIGVICGFVVAEAISIAVALILVNRDTGAPLRRGFDRFGLFLAAAGAIVAWNLTLAGPTVGGVAACVALTAVLAAAVGMRERATLAESKTVLARFFLPLREKGIF